MMECGLLGGRLSHSWSPRIHRMLGNYRYRLYERSPRGVEELLKRPDLRGLNVTIPYKKTVVPLCGELSPLARELGSVNTLVRREDGSLYGDNTDAAGFRYMALKTGADWKNKKVLVLGSGGASVTVQLVLRQLGACPVVISRRGENHYGNLERHRDAAAIVNTTPVGMYPRNGERPLDLRQFDRLEAVLDLIYNPARTALLLQAEELGIPGFGGLPMLVAQAHASSALWQEKTLPEGLIPEIEGRLRRRTENVVLVGMPGCGKSVLARILGRELRREVFDTDAWVEAKMGMTIPEIFSHWGEPMFRQMETEAARELGKKSGIVLATGGGIVTREENYGPLHQNGQIFWLKRDPGKLSKRGRPISQSTDLGELYRQREPLYERFADRIIDNNGSRDRTVRELLEVLK